MSLNLNTSDTFQLWLSYLIGDAQINYAIFQDVMEQVTTNN